MGRKSIRKDRTYLPSEIKHVNDPNSNNDLYRKRLRSWKRTSAPLKSHHLPVTESPIDDEDTSFYRSTIFTYPINLTADRQSIQSSAALSESLITESAFYCPSLSSPSIQATADLNNNHTPTSSVNAKKRKNSTSSCESLSSQMSSKETLPMLTNLNDEKNISTRQSLAIVDPQLTYYPSATKRSRFSPDDSIITNHRSFNPVLSVINDTIDINRQEYLSRSTIDQPPRNNPHSMEAAFKMVEPIVDIIFNAFEDQLKNVQVKTIVPTFSDYSTVSSPQLHPSIVVPSLPLSPPVRPLVLHAFNFNIQLTRKSSTRTSHGQYLTNGSESEGDSSQSMILTELKQKVVGKILSNNFLTNQNNRRRLKRMVQLAVFGASVLCGYLLL